jgi:hypothetical protein
MASFCTPASDWQLPAAPEMRLGCFSQNKLRQLQEPGQATAAQVAISWAAPGMAAAAPQGAQAAVSGTAAAGMQLPLS